jgi:hypothetical protein
MPEFNSFLDIFGQSAGPIIKDMDGFVAFDIDANNRSCTMLLNGQEYGIKREHNHKWHVVTIGQWWTFGSQWDLLAWIGDRL